MRKRVFGVMLLSLTVGMGVALAQNPTPAPAPPATGQPGSVPQMSQGDKKAISNSCTDQANAKGLHGNARKKFRSDCKHHGGKPS
jgi:hypothetical protein